MQARFMGLERYRATSVAHIAEGGATEGGEERS